MLFRSSHGDNLLEVEVQVHRIEYLSGDRHVYATTSVLGPDDAHIIARIPSTVNVDVNENGSQRFAVHEKDLRFFDGDSGVVTEPRPVRT